MHYHGKTYGLEGFPSEFLFIGDRGRERQTSRISEVDRRFFATSIAIQDLWLAIARVSVFYNFTAKFIFFV